MPYLMSFIIDARKLRAFVAHLLNNEFLYLTVDYVRWSAYMLKTEGAMPREPLLKVELHGRIIHFEFNYDEYFPQEEKKKGKAVAGEKT